MTLPGARRVVLPIALLATLLASLALLCIAVMAAARAYVGGESQWTRAQKTATQHLLRYAETADPLHWQSYERAIAVTLGDRRAREEMNRPDFDERVAYEGFLAGGNHPQDIAGLIRVYRWFGRMPYMRDAIAIWAAADDEVAALMIEAQGMKQAIAAGAPPQDMKLWNDRILAVDERLTALEQAFWSTIGQVSRLIEWLLTGAVLAGTLGAGLLAAASVRRDQVRGMRQAAALQRSEALFRSLWETTNDAVLILGTDHVIRFANPAAHRLFGHAAGSLAGQPVGVVQPPHLREAHRAGAERHLRTGERNVNWDGIEIEGLHASGRRMPIEVRFARFEMDGEIHFCGFIRDISARRAAEREVQQSRVELERRVEERTHELSEANRRLLEVDRLKSEFLATMSHELRTPLNAILGFTGVLSQGLAGTLNEEQLRQLAYIQGSGRHLLELINEVLDLSRIESGRMELAREPIDFGALIDEAVAQLRPLAAQKRLVLDAEAEAGLALRGDRRKLMQVLLNLGGNAVKFTEKGGVTMSARRVPGSGGHDTLVLEVVDSGIGIAAHQLPLLFKPFHQVDGSDGRAHEGTGLGLYLCKKLLELMGGSVEATSRPGQGSCFTVRLPIEAAATRTSPALTTAEA